jgi:hypothetical protein
MDITYTKHGDYYYPDLALPPSRPVTSDASDGCGKII